MIDGILESNRIVGCGLVIRYKQSSIGRERESTHKKDFTNTSCKSIMIIVAVSFTTSPSINIDSHTVIIIDNWCLMLVNSAATSTPTIFCVSRVRSVINKIGLEWEIQTSMAKQTRQNSLVPLPIAWPPSPPLASILALDPAVSVHAKKLTAPPEPPPPPPNELEWMWIKDNS